MTAVDELCSLLDECDEPYIRNSDGMVTWRYYTDPHSAIETLDGTLQVTGLTPAQAIVATVGRGTCRKVYLVEVCDDLLESWLPLAVYLHREAAEDCAEALRKEEDGVRQFARVSELKVVDE